MSKKKVNMQSIPEIGKEYHFFDDGKTGPSRHYICRCERVIHIGEAASMVIDTKDEDGNPYKETLFEIWVREKESCDWLFSESTDCFVEISCPKYDDNNLWAVRTKDGGWFTMNIQSWWQGGRMDVDGKIYKYLMERCDNDKLCELKSIYESETY